MLAPLNHAIVMYEQARRTPQTNNTNGDGAPAPPPGEGELIVEGTAAAAMGGAAAGEDESGSNEGSSTPTPGARADSGGGEGEGGSAGCETTGDGRGGSSKASEEAGEVGGFFFSDGGQETDFAAAFRIRVGEGNRDWPLTQVGAGGLRVARMMADRLAGGGSAEFCLALWYRNVWTSPWRVGWMVGCRGLLRA